MKNPKRFVILGALFLWLFSGCGEQPAGGTQVDIDGKADVYGEPTDTTRDSCVVSSTPPCLAEDPVLVESTLTEWTSQLNAIGDATDVAPPFGITECRWVHEVQGAVLCGSYRLETMNQMLARATMYIEGMVIGYRGDVVSTDDPINNEAAVSIAGHDLRSEDLLGFYDAVAQACEIDTRMCLTEHEQAMHDLLMDVEQNFGAFVIVTFAIESPMSPHEVVGHEILHAQYFLNDTFRGAVDTYWAQLETLEQEPIVEVLGRYYDPGDDLLMRNEFQAYILQPGAERSVLGRFVPTYREPLALALQQAGSPPVQCEIAEGWR